MKDTLKTASVSAFATLLAVGMFSFRPDGTQPVPRQAVVYEYLQLTSRPLSGVLVPSKAEKSPEAAQVLNRFCCMTGLNPGSDARNLQQAAACISQAYSKGWELVRVIPNNGYGSSRSDKTGDASAARCLFRRPRH